MAPHEELLQKIGIVRSRWKTFLWLRGLAWVLGVTVASLLIGVATLSPTAQSKRAMTVGDVIDLVHSTTHHVRIRDTEEIPGR